MSPPGNHSLRTKLAAGFSLAFCLVLGIGFFALLQIRQINQAAVEIRDGWLPRVERLGEIKRLVNQYETLLARSTQTTNFRHLAEITRSTKATKGAIDDAVEAFGGRLSFAEEQRLFSEFTRAWAEYSDIQKAVAERLELGEVAMAIHDLSVASLEAFYVANSHLDRLVAFAKQESQRTVDRAEAIYEFSLWCMIGLVTLGALCVIGATIWVRRHVSEPILRVAAAMRRLEAGELDTIIADHPRDDEIGSLVAAVSRYRESLLRGIELSAAAEIERERLGHAVEAMEHGVALFDAAGGKVLGNSRYVELPPDAAVDSWRSIVRVADERWLKLSENRASGGDRVCVQTDVTDLVRRERELGRAKEAAESASRVKSEFLANMSHELRTPLNAVIGFSEVIKDAIMGPVPAPYGEYASHVHASGRHLLDLINDILDLSKVEVGALELREEAVDLGSLIAGCNAMMAERAAKGGVVLVGAQVALPPINADERRLKQIVFNLVSNAVKFTPAGGRVTVSAEIGDAGDIVIAVADTGIGIAPDDIEIALAPFRQIDSAMNRRYQGTGLGLPLVKKLAELHGGTVAIESAVGSGTTVRVLLPADRVLVPAAAAA